MSISGGGIDHYTASAQFMNQGHPIVIAPGRAGDGHRLDSRVDSPRRLVQQRPFLMTVPAKVGGDDRKIHIAVIARSADGAGAEENHPLHTHTAIRQRPHIIENQLPQSCINHWYTSWSSLNFSRAKTSVHLV